MPRRRPIKRYLAPFQLVLGVDGYEIMF